MPSDALAHWNGLPVPKNFCKEANTGAGIKFPKWARIYVSYILPLVVLFIFVQGYWSLFHK